MKLCITGGGTGGHLSVAKIIAQEANANGHEVIFIGSLSGQDRDYFETSSPFTNVYFLDTKGVVNQKGLDKIKSLYKIFLAFLKARKILKQHRVKAVYSVGGFSAAPASFASLSLFKPLFIHEQNSMYGKLNSILKNFSKSFISAYDENSPIKGYPVADKFFKTQRKRDEFKTIIFLGGSQGAKTINDLAISLAPILKEKSINIIHQTGKNDFDRVQKAYKDLNVNVELFSFSDDMVSFITKADLAVSRAGASTLWELVSNGCPTFFIPYPYASSNHQYYNAKFIVENKMGWCQKESKDLKDRFLEILDRLELEEKSKRLLNSSKKGVAYDMIKDLEKKVR